MAGGHVRSIWKNSRGAPRRNLSSPSICAEHALRHVRRYETLAVRAAPEARPCLRLVRYNVTSAALHVLSYQGCSRFPNLLGFGLRPLVRRVKRTPGLLSLIAVAQPSSINPAITSAGAPPTVATPSPCTATPPPTAASSPPAVPPSRAAPPTNSHNASQSTAASASHSSVSYRNTRMGRSEASWGAGYGGAMSGS